MRTGRLDSAITPISNGLKWRLEKRIPNLESLKITGGDFA